MDQYQNVNLQDDDESEISLLDLLYHILRRWRSILLFAVLFCVLLGGVKLVKGILTLGSADAKEEQKNYESQLEGYTISKEHLENQIKELTQSIQDKEDYYDHSILMNLDPKKSYKGAVTFVVTDARAVPSADENRVWSLAIDRKMDSVLGSYAALIQNGTILRNVQNGLSSKLDQKYLAELIYTQVDYQSKLLHITVVGDDKQQAQSISDAIVQGLQNASVQMNVSVAAHRLELLSSYVGNDADTSIPIGMIPEAGANTSDASYQTSIEELQKNYTSSITDMQNQLLDCNNQLSELEEPEPPVGASRTSVLKEGIKYGIIGFIAGAFVLAFVYALQYLLCGKLMDSDELNDRYGILLLGDYYAPLHAHTNRIDRWIDRMNGITGEKQSVESVYALSAANILAQVDAEKNPKLLLMGNAKSEDFNAVATALSEKLCSSGIDVITAGNVNESASAIEKLQEADQVVLIEQRGASRQQDIQKELLTLRKLEKKIIGAIVL